MREKRTAGAERGGNPDHRERRERQRNRSYAVHRGLHKKKFPNPLTGKMTGADYCEFLRPAELKD